VAASFAPAAVDQQVPSFARAAKAAAAGWADGVAVDMAATSTATTMRVITESLFGGDPRLTSDAAMAHIAAALEGVSEARIQVLLGLPLIPLSRRGRAGRRGQIYLRETLGAVAEDRRRGGSDDFLSRLIADLHTRFPAEEARALAVDNAATFYLAGHETTANAVTWTLYLLSEQPALQDAVAGEARAALSGGEHDPDLPERLPLLRRVIEESMRLYPPVPRFDRQAVAADELAGHEVRPGDIVSIWPWIVQRHKKLWGDADAFDPERWTDAGRADMHRFQYIPFGGGPRICVGMRFAMAEALTVLGQWLASWRFKPMPGRQVRPSGMVTLRPAGGLPLGLEARS
jgi:cytochrome P450